MSTLESLGHSKYTLCLRQEREKGTILRKDSKAYEYPKPLGHSELSSTKGNGEGEKKVENRVEA